MKKVLFTCAAGSVNWLNYARVTLKSMVDNNPGVDVWLFTNETGFKGIKTEDIVIPGVKVKSLDLNIENKDLAGFTESQICIRIPAFEYLKQQGYDVAVYMDSDAIQLNPFPDNFWKYENGASPEYMSKLFHGIDIVSRTFPSKGTCKHWVKSKGHWYFNSGFIRANLKDSCWDNVWDKYLTHRVTTTDTGSCVDQDFLNRLLFDNHEYLGMEYNFNGWLSDLCERGNFTDKTDGWDYTRWTPDAFPSVLEQLRSKIYVVHWVAGGKPWRNLNVDRPNSLCGFQLPWLELALTVPEIDETTKSAWQKVMTDIHEKVNPTRTDVDVPVLPAVPENVRIISLENLFG